MGGSVIDRTIHSFLTSSFYNLYRQSVHFTGNSVLPIPKITVYAVHFVSALADRMQLVFLMLMSVFRLWFPGLTGFLLQTSDGIRKFFGFLVNIS